MPTLLRLRFEKNLQGDIIAVYNSAGTKLVSYVYDAWGNATIAYHNGGNSTTAKNNPFRYRGYYYDTHFALYYLNSRYYDSNTGRFISADGYVSTGQGLIGSNMYAYCENNPVMRVDPTGQFWRLFVAIAVAVVVVAAVIIYECVEEELIETNYEHNSKIDADPATTTKNKEIDSQQKVSAFNYGFKDAGYNGCEVIAVHNAKVAMGIESSLSETMRDFQNLNAMMGLGFLGSNPLKIGTVLDYYGMNYTNVSLDQMTKDGIYIVSYWTPHSSGLYQIHTVMMECKNEKFDIHNGNKTPEKIGKYYLCGYYLG